MKRHDGKHDWTLGSRGDPHAEPGSAEWAVYTRSQLQSFLEDRESSVEHLSYAYEAMIKYEGWRHLYAKNKRPFTTFEAFCVEKKPWGLDYSPEVIEALMREKQTPQQIAENAKDLNENGAVGRGRENSYNNVIAKQGNSAEYLTARIKRDHPEVYNRMLADEYRSVRAAAIDAGIIREQPPVEKIKKLWLKMTPEEKEQFQIWATEQL